MHAFLQGILSMQLLHETMLTDTGTGITPQKKMDSITTFMSTDQTITTKHDKWGDVKFVNTSPQFLKIYTVYQSVSKYS